jgi:hypothetical protein
MKSISLGSIYDVLASEDDSLIEAFFNYNGGSIKELEKTDLLCLVSKLMPLCIIEQQAGYFVGQKTKSGISEEFDLLRFSNESIINIEIKHEWPSNRQKCLNQLRSHHNILKLLNSKVYCYSYIVSTEELFILETDQLVQTDFSSLVKNIPLDFIDDNCLYSVDYSSMLISPYSDPDKFANHEYVLTNNQSEIKQKIINSTDKVSAIHGRAGTGKSLLLMDIASYYRSQNKNVLVLLCRNFDEKWNISNILDICIDEIKFVGVESIDKYDVILVDEAQRIDKEKFDLIKNMDIEKVVFSLDPDQTLHYKEVENHILDEIRTITSAKNIYEISSRIRANDALEMFSRKLVCLNCSEWDYDKWRNLDTSCIHISFFSDEAKCVEYLGLQHKIGKTVIEFTPYITKSTYNLKRELKFNLSRYPHNVLGEEFDDVVFLLDEYIVYKDIDGKKVIDSTYNEHDYYPHNENHSIYEAITRAKKSLEIVIFNNPKLYKIIREIFNADNHDIPI